MEYIQNEEKNKSMHFKCSLNLTGERNEFEYGNEKKKMMEHEMPKIFRRNPKSV